MIRSIAKILQKKPIHFYRLCPRTIFWRTVVYDDKDIDYIDKS